VKLPPYRVALGVGEPQEARLLALLEDPSFGVGGRGCSVTTFCSTIREAREALGRTDSIDVVVMSSTLQALPAATLDQLVATGRPLIVVAPDPAAPRWAELAVPVLGPDADAAGLAAAIGDALLRRRSVRQHAAPAPAAPAPAVKSKRRTGAGGSNARAATPLESEVITVTGAETHEGTTSVAVSLAYTLSFADPTVLLDANARGSAVEFHLPVDPARGLPQLGRRLRDGGGWQQTLTTTAPGERHSNPSCSQWGPAARAGWPVGSAGNRRWHLWRWAALAGAVRGQPGRPAGRQPRAQQPERDLARPPSARTIAGQADGRT